MTSFLAVCILIVGNLFVSSASILETKELTLTATTTSPVTSPVASPTSVTPSTGYITTVIYSDSTCKTLLFAIFLTLNVCNEIGDSSGFYEILTANATAVTSGVYTDSKCTLNGTLSEQPLTGKCVDNTMQSISASRTFTSDTPTVIYG